MADRANALAVGVLVAFLATGCGSDGVSRAPAATERTRETPVGPHLGALVAWGEQHRVEFVADRVTGEVTVYVLGRDARTPAPVATDEIVLSLDEPAIQVALKPSPQARDPMGTSSRFVGSLPDSTRGWRLRGVLSGVVDGNRVSGELVEFRPRKH